MRLDLIGLYVRAFRRTYTRIKRHHGGAFLPSFYANDNNAESVA